MGTAPVHPAQISARRLVILVQHCKVNTAGVRETLLKPQIDRYDTHTLSNSNNCLGCRALSRIGHWQWKGCAWLLLQSTDLTYGKLEKARNIAFKLIEQSSSMIFLMLEDIFILSNTIQWLTSNITALNRSVDIMQLNRLQCNLDGCWGLLGSSEMTSNKVDDIIVKETYHWPKSLTVGTGVQRWLIHLKCSQMSKG